MSAGKTSEYKPGVGWTNPYGVIRSQTPGRPFMVVNSADPCGYGVMVDSFRTRIGATYAARMLNSGLAIIDQYRPVGCRVEMVR